MLESFPVSGTGMHMLQQNKKRSLCIVHFAQCQLLPDSCSFGSLLLRTQKHRNVQLSIMCMSYTML